MGRLVLYISLTIMLPIMLLIFFLEKRARRVMLSCICGVLVCIAAYFINTLISKKYPSLSANYSITIAPIIEEVLKFIPLTIFCFVLKKGKRQTIAMAFAVGVGFCIVENFFYLFNNYDNASIVWVIFRCIGTGLMHSMSTTLIGYGLYRARNDKSLLIIMGLSILSFSIMYHGLYNLLVASTKYNIVGISIPIISYVLVLLILKKDFIKDLFKHDEANEQENLIKEHKRTD